MDVLDLAWRFDDKLLASCSIDNRILIWQVLASSSISAPARVLNAHKSWVKASRVERNCTHDSHR